MRGRAGADEPPARLRLIGETAEFTGVFHLDFTLFFLHNALESGTMHVDRKSNMQRLCCTIIEKPGRICSRIIVRTPATH